MAGPCPGSWIGPDEAGPHSCCRGSRRYTSARVSSFTPPVNARRWCDGGVDDEPLEFAERRPASVRWLSILVIGLVVAAAAVFGMRRPVASNVRAATPAPAADSSTEAVLRVGPMALPPVSRDSFPADTAAVVLGEVPPFASFERTDDAVAEGPWSLVIRRSDGALGRRGAVITYPVAAPAWGQPVQLGHLIGTAVAAGFVWPIVGAHARIRGDLPRTDLVRLALGTSVLAGRPAVRRLPAGYSVVLAAPYRSPSIREIRYHATQLSAAMRRLGGLVSTGLLTAGAGLEDRMYALSATDVGWVHGRPAPAATMAGDSRTVAWEVAPGTVAYLAYSGTETDQVIDVLRQLAGQSRPLCGKQWQANAAQRSRQRNDFG